MSNYLITLKLNYLQSEIDLLKAVDGLTNPLGIDIIGDGHSMTDMSEIGCTSLVSTGTIQSLHSTVYAGLGFSTPGGILTGGDANIQGTVQAGNVVSDDIQSAGNITAAGTVSGVIVSGATIQGGNISASGTMTASGAVTGATVNASTLLTTKNILFQNIPTKDSITINQSTDPVLYLTNTSSTTPGYLNDNYYNPPLSTGPINDLTLVIPSGGLPPRVKQYRLDTGGFSFNVAGQGFVNCAWGASLLEIPLPQKTYVYNNISLQFNTLTMQINFGDPPCNALFCISSWFNPSDPQSQPTVIAASYKRLNQGNNFISFGSTLLQTSYIDNQFHNALYLTMATDSTLAFSSNTTILAFALKGANYTVQQSPIRPVTTAFLPPGT